MDTTMERQPEQKTDSLIYRERQNISNNPKSLSDEPEKSYCTGNIISN
jgi:hypothetical protein